MSTLAGWRRCEQRKSISDYSVWRRREVILQQAPSAKEASKHFILTVCIHLFLYILQYMLYPTVYACRENSAVGLNR
jgi:hypothetical protein